MRGFAPELYESTVVERSSSLPSRESLLRSTTRLRCWHLVFAGAHSEASPLHLLGGAQCRGIRTMKVVPSVSVDFISMPPP
jgi:hypothetical protein